MSNVCPVCLKRVLSHAQRLQCDNCHKIVHLSCLSNVTKHDELYINRHDNIWYCPVCMQDALPLMRLEDDEYMDVIFNWKRDEKHVSIEELNNMIFIPFEINDQNTFSPLFEIDPDIQFFNSLANNLSVCDYYLEDSFNKKCTDLHIDQTCFSLLHTNIRSMPKNLTHLHDYLDLLNIKFSILGISETWLHVGNYENYNISGYQAAHNYRASRQGGGVSLLIADDLTYIMREDLRVMDAHLECLFIELDGASVNSDRNYVVGVVYRPPNTNVDLFSDTLSNIITKIKSENKKCFIMGDYNINLLNCDKHTPTEDFINMMFSSSFFPTINKPTRVSNTSATLIDNIFSNDSEAESLFHGILYTDISDHYPIFYIDNSAKIHSEPKVITFRDCSERNMSRFIEKIASTDWSPVLQCPDPEAAYTSFHNEFLQTYNTCFPIKVSKNKYKCKKTWLTTALKNSIKNKNKLYLISKKHPTSENILIYKQFRNKLNSLIRSCERKHYEDLFKDRQTNLKKKWSLIKEIINKKNNHSHPPSLKINNKEITDKLSIANTFNKYFVNIGPQLASSIKPNQNSPLHYLNDANPGSIFLIPVTDHEVEKIIKNMKISSPGWDSISGKVIKATYQSFIMPLTHVLNASISCGKFPDELKIAKVLPLFKSGDIFNCNNYRPISILPYFSKILERLLYNRMLNFINQNSILYYLQFGFREGHSTGMALVNLVDKIVSSMDKDEYALTVFLDFSKAFDTVDHKILFSKLEHYGIRGLALDMIKSYLSNRMQYVDIDGFESSKQLIKCGIPQGSILGPLLFLLYVNDIANVSDVFVTTIFADDTTLFCSGTNVDDIVQNVNTAMDKIVDWLQCNKLSLNIAKSNYMLFTNKKVSSNIRICIENKCIARVTNTKFLGITLDEKLCWKEHIMAIKKKISRGIGILNKARKVLHNKPLVDMYYAFIYPYLSYGIEVWGNTFNTYLLPLLKLQKKVVRMISNSQYLAHSDPLFRKLEILKVSKLYILQNQIYMYKFLNKTLPCVFDHMFIRNTSIHSQNTRQASHFHLPRCRTNIYQSSFKPTCIRLYNQLESKIDYSLKSFKKKLRLYLLSTD